jgi:hypothetical protein
MREGQFYTTRFASPQGALIPWTPQESLVVYHARSRRRRTLLASPAGQLCLFELLSTGSHPPPSASGARPDRHDGSDERGREGWQQSACPSSRNGSYDGWPLITSALRGAIASHHQELVRALHTDKGNLSHCLRLLERPGVLVIGRSTGRPQNPYTSR